MTLEEEIKLKLAKSDRNGGTTETIREHTDLLLKEAEILYELKYITLPEYTNLRYACEKHDYGKVNEAMQARMKSKNRRFDEDEEVQHNILSALFVHRDDFENENDFLAVLYAVLYHHDNREDSETLASVLRRGNSLIDEFMEAYEPLGAIKQDGRLLKRLDKITDYRDCDSITEEERNLFDKLVKLKGLLHKCDYSASAHIACEYPNDFLMNKMAVLPDKFTKDKANGSEKCNWNELQLFAMENGDKNVVITAPTGCGKTEAGLLWTGDSKGVFTLPLKTAINAMYDRIRYGILDDEKSDERIALLHSDMQAYYLGESETNDGIVDTDSVINYTVRSRQMSLPITVATLDQVFDFVLKFYGYEYKLSTLSYSKVIIDEIQMYSPELLAYLMYGIKKIVEMGGKVAVLTATLPPFAKDKLLENMGENVVLKDFSYLGAVRHNVKVCKEQLNSDDIIDKWHEFSDKDSRKFLVICNSIKTAQRIYHELCNKLSGEDIEINLLHANFTKEDRRRKEKQIKLAGRTYDENGNRDCSHQIWVSTSVVEASLDIDFDYLFTELLELFSLFQRFGRVNRKGIKGNSEYNCFVYTELQDGPLKAYGKRREEYKFVDDKMYDLSKTAILTVDGVIDEKAKKDLIDRYLSTDKLEGSEYVVKYNKAYEELGKLYVYEKEKCPIREIMNIDIIPYSVYESNCGEIDDLENSLNGGGLDAIGRIRAIEKIRDFTVSVNLHRVKEHEKCIKVGRRFKIPVIHCDYDDKVGLGDIHKPEKTKAGSRFL